MNKDYNIYWDEIKKEFEGFQSPANYNMIINRVEYQDFDQKNKIMKLSVPSNFIKDHIIKYKNDFESSLSKLYGDKCKIEFFVDENSTNNPDKSKKSGINKLSKAPEKEKKESKSLPNKTDDFSFESFIIGNSNEFAAKAALAVAENPGIQYNPYFVWGDNGLGKTHLLRAIEKYTRDYFPSKKVKYVTAEEFTNDFVNSLSTKKMEQFRIKYRTLDVLIVDDVQFFADKESLQGEVFNTFNKLYDDRKQMLFSCDQPIKKVKNMEERLKSRFAMGLVVDLRPPDFELRMAIIKYMSQKHSINIEFNAMEYICTNINGSIRELKGAFQLLVAYSSLMKTPITLDVTKEKLKELITDTHSNPVSVDKIIQFVAEYYNLKSHEVIGTKKTKSIALARQIAMYISRKITRLSTTQIGKYFGDKEHGTVMHATKKVEDYISKDIKIKKDIENLIKEIQNK